MIPWDYDKIDEHYYSSDEHRYSKYEITENIDDVIFPQYFTDMNNINHVYGNLYSD